MAYAYQAGGSWLEIFGAFTIGEGDAAIQYPADWPALATEEREAAGVAEIAEADPPPAWMTVIGRELVDVAGIPTRRWITQAIDIETFRARQLAAMNVSAGAFRARFITDIPGQQATYLAKEAEAKAWAEGADPADFPYLAHEAAASGKTIAEIVALVLATADAWRAMDPKIEGRRRGACVAIAAAETPEDIILAATVDWGAALAG